MNPYPRQTSFDKEMACQSAAVSRRWSNSKPPGTRASQLAKQPRPPRAGQGHRDETLPAPNEPGCISWPRPAAEVDGGWAVTEYYTPLFRFGLRLTRNRNDSADLTQETFRILYAKGAGIRDAGKVRGWLYTTLYRLFLRRRRHDIRFPATTLESVEWDLPTIGPGFGREFDRAQALSCLRQLDETFRVPLAMFYLENKSYKEVAMALGVPIGTIMSRLSRGKNLLRQLLQTPLPEGSRTP